MIVFMKPMKTISIIVIISLFIILSFAKCTHCYSCLETGNSIVIPYNDGDSITFINDSLKKIKFLIKKEVLLPPNKYCGQIGSDSETGCNGSEFVSFVNNDSNININIKYYTDGSSNGVELPVCKSIQINNRDLTIFDNYGKCSDYGFYAYNRVSKVINNINYANLYELVSIIDQEVFANDCVYILYSLEFGILRFGIKKSDNYEFWTLQKE
jgi:hypothetical protein